MTTNVTHTPGPWTTGRSVCGDVIVVGADQFPVAGMRQNKAYGAARTFEVAQANARLIAAAPEMAQLLIRAYSADVVDVLEIGNVLKKAGLL